MASILVAEDDEPVRETVRRGLELDGHEVETASDGAEALAMLRAGPAPDLLLTDIKMPVMDGIELALTAASEWPDLPILLMTGFADQRERAEGLDALVREVIQKPFALGDLRDLVRGVLAEPAGAA